MNLRLRTCTNMPGQFRLYAMNDTATTGRTSLHGGFSGQPLGFGELASTSNNEHSITPMSSALKPQQPQPTQNPSIPNPTPSHQQKVDQSAAATTPPNPRTKPFKAPNPLGLVRVPTVRMTRGGISRLGALNPVGFLAMAGKELDSDGAIEASAKTCRARNS